MYLIDNYWFSINNDSTQFQKELCTNILQFYMWIWNSEIMYTLRLSKDIRKYTVDRVKFLAIIKRNRGKGEGKNEPYF